MAPLLLLLLLLPLAAAHVGAEGREAPQRYTRQWAVHVEGGPPVADAVAAKHGFVNLGQVCTGISMSFILSYLLGEY
ncbi:furin-like [Schistocerca nitens]|uniref:furin-like n=1 Tax=Schistocerca nitens TaxID=7011 RepID=UPI002118005E|nr:furin-like [Schistocerca nitens]